MAKPELKQLKHYVSNVSSRCPDCNGPLAILRVIGSRSGAEYWAMQCTTCRSIHLDIVEPPTRH
jgi:Zn finger protein HypA/HybF involved in hydrogenase expression